ncbi:MAG: 3-dehydroquinate dehydratase [Flavobacteriales bacterium]|nr:3-dehydroquinate dehydratase [Flavobacteriales bacterium]
MKEIVIINGPNLNLLGKREPEIYGTSSFEEYFKVLQKKYNDVSLSYFQSNIEGELIDYLHKFGFSEVSIVLNAAGYTHTSIALADAVAAIDAEVIEVHISQPAAREKERHTSILSKYCKGSISGLGLHSYDSAINYFMTKEDL